MNKPACSFLLKSCQPLRFRFIIIFLVAITASALDSFYPYWVKELIDNLLQSRAVQAYKIWLPFATIALIWLLKECLHRFTTILGAMIFPRYRMLLRLLLVRKLLYKPYYYFLQKNTGSVSSRLDLIMTTSEKILSAMLLSYLGLLINLMVTIFLLVEVDINFVFLVFFWLIYHCSVTSFFLRKGGGYSKLQARVNANLTGNITDLVINFFASSCFNAQKFLFSYIVRQQRRAVRVELKTSWHFEKLKIWQSLGAIFLLFFTLFLLFRLSQNTHFEVGNLPMVLMLVGSFLASFWTVVDQFAALFNNFHQLSDALEHLQISNNKDMPKTCVAKRQHFASLELKEVAFSYPNASPVINNISFVLNAHQKIFIQASNGKGKTTLLCLLAGLLSPTDGSIQLNNVQIEKEHSNILQKQTLLLLAKPVLLHRTLLDNVRLVSPRAGIAEVMQALDYADCGFVHHLSMGIYTVIKEEGRNLSHGQRQRLNLARAFLSRANILLLDEPFANIDTLSRQKISLNLLSVLSDKTIVIADHQNYYEHQFDQIINL